MTTLSTILILQKIPTEAIIALAFLAILAVAICYIIRIGRKECEMIFESDYDNLRTFIKECHVNEETELRIRLRLIHLSKYPGANKEKLQVLNTEFRRKFVPPTLSDVVADHESN